LWLGLALAARLLSICTMIFVGTSVAAFALLPWITPRFFRRFGDRSSELEAESNYRWATRILMPSLKTRV
jgi:glutathione-regulated potassium-efflux system ancillary protein KefC